MAATDLSSLSRGHGVAQYLVTLEATAGLTRRVILPGWCRSVGVSFRDSAGAVAGGTVALEGTDGSAQSATAEIVGDGYQWREAILGGASLYLAGDDDGKALLTISAVRE